MRKMLFAVAATAIALTGASAAYADSFTPASSTATFEGSVDVFKDINLTCDMSVTVASNAAGDDASVTAASLSGGLCGLVSFQNLPWNIDVSAPAAPPTGVAATKLKIKGAKVQTVFGGTCGPGDLEVNWSSGTITIPAGTPLNPGGCTIGGILSQTSGPSITITN